MIFQLQWYNTYFKCFETKFPGKFRPRRDEVRNGGHHIIRNSIIDTVHLLLLWLQNKGVLGWARHVIQMGITNPLGKETL
jgi:hypothetical protein